MTFSAYQGEESGAELLFHRIEAVPTGCSKRWSRRRPIDSFSCMLITI
jgi:hypothetical protein